ncbi:MAG: hypothetical protein AB8B89_09755 [Gammaproteobacteria bacterium]
MTDDSQISGLAEMVFISEIVKQAKIAKRAAVRLHATNNYFDEIEVWCSIQSILVAAGNISKILWPSHESRLPRGEKLRALLEVELDNLLSDRKFRNHFEHYDERIEDWFKSNNSAVYSDSRINSLEPTPWSFPQFFHRDYNSESQILTFRGESIDLGAVIKELELIQKKCRGFCLQ